LTVKTSNPNDAGSHKIDVIYTLTRYPTIT